jgi:hypothetical protein
LLRSAVPIVGRRAGVWVEPAAAFVASFVAFLIALAILSPGTNGDEPHYVLQAASIARDLDLDMADEYDDPALVQQAYGAPSVEPDAYTYPGGHGLASVHTAGLPLLLAPVAAVTVDPRLMRIEMALIAAIGAALLMALLQRLAIRSPVARWLAWAAVVLSAPVVVYAVSLYPEVPGMTMLLGAVLLLARPRPGPWALAGASLLAAYLPWLNVRFAALTAVLALVALWHAWRSPRRGLALAAVIVPLAVSALALAGLFDYLYGSPSPSAPYAVSTSSRTWSGVYRFGVGGLFSSQYGWLPNAPVQILGIVAIGLLVRRLGRPALVGVLGAGAYVLVVAGSGVGFPGSSFGGRLFVVLMPLVAIPLLVFLATQRRWWAWGSFALLGALTLLLTANALSGDTDGTLRARYDRLWPNFDARHEAAAQQWRPTVDELRHPAARVVHPGAPTQETDGALLAPAGRPGVLLAATTPSLTASSVDTGVLLRTDTDTQRLLARIEVRDATGRLVRSIPVRGRALPPQVGWRSIQFGFHTDRDGPLSYRLITTGAVPLWASAPRLATNPAATLRNSSGIRAPGRTIVWVAVLVGLGAALVVYDRRRGSPSLA